MSDDRFENYMLDLGSLIKEKARDAKTEKLQDGDAYNTGYLMAWHEIISLMQSQARQFHIPLHQIGLGDIEPDRELL